MADKLPAVSVHIRVPGKVNPALVVGPNGADGYHELATVFQALSLYDEITATLAPPGEFSLAFRGEGSAFLPVDDTNLAIRAAKAMAEEFEVADAGVELLIHKSIPVAGGMAGGSADAAGVLVACNELWGVGASAEQLRDVAARLGADVPFLLVGETAVGTGRGDVITPVPCQGTYHWTLALAHGGLSTPAVFSQFDAMEPDPPSPEVDADLLAGLADGDVHQVAQRLRNDLMPAALELQPGLQRTLDLGLNHGALAGIISGSGPTCAFLSESEADAQRVADAVGEFSGVRTARTAHGPVPGAQVVR